MELKKNMKKGNVKTLKQGVYYFTLAVNREGKEIKLFRPARIIKNKGCD